jgi:hypothetical protein
MRVWSLIHVRTSFVPKVANQILDNPFHWPGIGIMRAKIPRISKIVAHFKQFFGED